jgi:trk system potassium uptake protein TrkH
MASFQAVSMQTTTGFATADFDAWPSFARLLLVLLMFVGGCAGSTGGSMKVVRFMIMGKLAVVQVLRFFRPRQVSSVRVGSDVVDEALQRGVAAFFVLFLATWVVLALALALMGADLVTAVSASIACLGNIGPGLAAVGATQNYAFFGLPAKLLLSAAMIIGRLEVFTVIGLFTRSFWKP